MLCLYLSALAPVEAMARLQHDDHHPSPTCRRPGRAVVLLAAMMGTYLFHLGSSMAASSPPSDSDEDDSDVPLAPPEEPPQMQVEEHTPRLMDPDEVHDYPVPHMQGEPPLHEPPGPSDRPSRPAARRGAAASSSSPSSNTAPTANPNAGSQNMAMSTSASSSTCPTTGSTPAQPLGPGDHQLHEPGHDALHDPRLPQHADGALYWEWSAWDDVDEGDAPLTPQQGMATDGMRGAGGSSSGMPYASQPIMPSPSTTRLGFATTYDPASDPWHDDGNLDPNELRDNTLAHMNVQHSGHSQPWQQLQQSVRLPGQQQPQQAGQQGQTQPHAPLLPSGADHDQARPPPLPQPHQAQGHAQGGAVQPPFKQPPPRPPSHNTGPLQPHQPLPNTQPVQFQRLPPVHPRQGPENVQLDEWGTLARTLANGGPLLPPTQWMNNYGIGWQPPPPLPHQDPLPAAEQQEPSDDDNSGSVQPDDIQLPAEPDQDLLADEQSTNADADEQPLSMVDTQAEEMETQCSRDPEQAEVVAPNHGLPEHQEAPSLDPPELAEEDEEWIEILEEEEEGDIPNVDNDEGEADWISDVSDTDEDEVSPPPQSQQHSATAGGNPTTNSKKRPAGHGSQRVKNKAKKSDVKKLWQDAGWDPKPAWLTWRAALDWFRRGEQPPRKRPTSSPAERAKFAALLSAHQYVRDEKGNVVPPSSTTASSSTSATSPSTQHGQQAAGVTPSSHGEKAENQARQDHKHRQAHNPYRQPQQQPRPLPQREPRPVPEHNVPAREQIAPAAEVRRVSFSLPQEHREHPPKPVRQEKVVEQLIDAVAVQRHPQHATEHCGQ